MGGLIILSSIIITSVFYIPSYPKIIPVLFVTVGFGIIGFLDDYIKIVMKRSEGLKPMQKLVGQFIITGIFAWYLLNSGEVGTDMLIPFTGGFDGGSFLSLGIFFVPALFFIMLGTDNGVNFTDGLDGLCTSVTILVATFLTIVAIGEDMGISPITGAVVGSLLGFRRPHSRCRTWRRRSFGSPADPDKCRSRFRRSRWSGRRSHGRR